MPGWETGWSEAAGRRQLRQPSCLPGHSHRLLLAAKGQPKTRFWRAHRQEWRLPGRFTQVFEPIQSKKYPLVGIV
ncbi:hypothetical protein D0T11_19335 [Hymenobacter rubripertinctus]|uniref:Uncharacterized protein n=1 Tax=Hymenobacter rubripertinctus TaxID=2029981 RepID=A0A418QLF7_9BACT|nr:hypothetical protein D0T11_19335 [Hymenobacter rubripertinctus]